MSSGYDLAIEKFYKVIHGSSSSEMTPTRESHTIPYLKELVDHLAQNAPVYNFSFDLANTFRTIKFDPASMEIVYTDVDGEYSKHRLDTKPIGAGTYATIYRERSGKTAYKIQKIIGKPDEESNTVRDILMEVWIQIVLSCDSTYGKHIPTVTSLTKLMEGGAPTAIVIEMELLSTTIEQFIAPKGKHGMDFSYIQPSIVKLIQMLQYFRKNYGFVHRDLHNKNVMFDGRSIMILDFGLSCMTYNDSKRVKVVYANPTRFPVGCWSFDMFIFFASLLSNVSTDQYLSDACIKKLLSFFEIENTKYPNLYNALPAFERPGVWETKQPRFWAFYADTIKNIGLYAEIPAGEKEVEEHLAKMLALAGGGGGGSGSTSNSSASTYGGRRTRRRKYRKSSRNKTARLRLQNRRSRRS